MMPSRHPWWKDAIVYQIYPASFKCLLESPDSPSIDDPAVGNIRGIISKIPYLASIGFDTVWLSPIFASPQKDMGYDISDYRAIHPPYGTVSDVQDLIARLHSTMVPVAAGESRPMRLLMDLVVNHTSDQHPWFLESASSRTNSKQDWYFWRDPKLRDDGTHCEPNNWRSIFGGPAWHYVPSREQYYLALFLPSQPDLNWENADMRADIYADMRFWMDKGVDGWRIDSMNLMSKHPEMPDAEVTEPGEWYQDGSKYYASGPKIHHYLQEMRQVVFERYGPDRIFTVGEMGSVDSEESVSKYVARDRKELNCVFHGMDLDFGPKGKYDGSSPFTVEKLRRVTDRWQTAMPGFDGWNTVYLDNHDSGRSLTRYANPAPQHRSIAAKMLALYVCTLSGTPFVLNGQEIGMANLPQEVGIEGYTDVEGQNWYHKVEAERGQGADMGDVMQQLRLKARDHGRLPMQWNAHVNAGFCNPSNKPWMTVNPDHKDWNVRSQLESRSSVLAFWRQMIQVRRKFRDVLVHGKYTASQWESSDDVIIYERYTEQCRMVVIINFSNEPGSVKIVELDAWETVVSNFEEIQLYEGETRLRSFEALVLRHRWL